MESWKCRRRIEGKQSKYYIIQFKVKSICLTKMRNGIRGVWCAVVSFSIIDFETEKNKNKISNAEKINDRLHHLHHINALRITKLHKYTPQIAYDDMNRPWLSKRYLVFERSWLINTFATATAIATANNNKIK